MKIKKNKRINIKETEAYYAELTAVSDATDKTISDFIREAIDEKKLRLARRNPKVAEIVNREVTV